MKKRLLSLLIAIMMIVTLCPARGLDAYAEEVATGETMQEEGENLNLEDLYVTSTETRRLDENSFQTMVLLDAGRKYFSVAHIETIIDEMAAKGYTALMLGLGNDGLRFLLDDMSLTVGATTYSSEQVTEAIQAGNQAYSDQTWYGETANELTQSDMDAILAYALEKEVQIVPLINTPGHMDAVLDAAEALTGSSCAYHGSGRTIDVTSATAVAFSQRLLTKYIAYFAEKGCTAFNIGADEYANDLSSSSYYGFAGLQSIGNYAYYINYVNSIAAIIKNYGMVPMAFNDGIYYNNVTGSGTFDSDIAVCYWTNGWSGYTVMSSQNLAARGHQIINTNSNWYYVLGSSGSTTGWSTYEHAYQDTHNIPVTQTVDSGATPIGSMLAFWCDTPSVQYTTTEQTKYITLIDRLADSNPGYFRMPEESITLKVGETSSAIVMEGEQSITEHGDETIASAELQVMEEGQTVAYAATASTSTEAYSSYGVSNLIDGNSSTYYWSNGTQTAGMYARIDLGALVWFDAVQVTSTAHQSDYCMDAEVQVSSDGQTWMTIGSFSGEAGDSVSQTYEVPQSVGCFRYIQVMLTNASNSWWQLAEISWGSYVDGTFTRAATEGTASGKMTMTSLTFTGQSVGSTCYVVDGTKYIITVQPAYATVTGASLTLDGKIGVNFYVDLPDQASYITLNDEKISVSEGKSTDDVDSDKSFTYSVSVKKLNDEITLNVYDKDGQKIDLKNNAGDNITDTGCIYSAMDYINTVIADQNADQDLVSLLKTLSDYGSYAQTYFNYNNDHIAEIYNADDIAAVTADTLAGFAMVTDGEVDGLNYYGNSLLLGSGTTDRIYFSLEDGAEISNYTFTLDGNSLEPVSKGSLYYISINNIPAAQLSETHELIVKGTSEESNSLIMTFSPLSYVVEVLSIDNADANLTNMMKALYLYYAAAKEYFS